MCAGGEEKDYNSTIVIIVKFMIMHFLLMMLALVGR